MPNGVGTCRVSVGAPSSVSRPRGSMGSSQFRTVRSGRVSRRSRRASRQASEAGGTIDAKRNPALATTGGGAAPAKIPNRRLLNVGVSHAERNPVPGKFIEERFRGAQGRIRVLRRLLVLNFTSADAGWTGVSVGPRRMFTGIFPTTDLQVTPALLLLLDGLEEGLEVTGTEAASPFSLDDLEKDGGPVL